MLDLVLFISGLICGLALSYPVTRATAKRMAEAANKILSETEIVTKKRDSFLLAQMEEIEKKVLIIDAKALHKQKVLIDEIHALHALLRWLEQYCADVKPRGALHDVFKQQWQELMNTRRSNNAIQ